MTTPEIARVARAADLFEQRRDRLATLAAVAADLDQVDVIVVDGEQAVLANLAERLGQARELLAKLAAGTAGPSTLDRFEGLLAADPWVALDEVQRLFDDKRLTADEASRGVQLRLERWEEVMIRVEELELEFQAGNLLLVRPRDLALGRDRLADLMRQVRTGVTGKQLLDVWRALDELDSFAPVTDGGERQVAADQVPDRLQKLLDRARVAAGRLQLTVLRGAPDGNKVDYTLMLSTVTGDRQMGLNLQDNSTLVRRNRQEFVDGTRIAIDESYRAAADPAATEIELPADAPGRPQDLQGLGQKLYRLLIPNRLKEEIDRHPDVPMVVITNDRELSWELMCHDNFIALDRPLARMPVGRFAYRGAPSTDHGKLYRRVALIASTGRDRELAGAGREVTRIKQGLIEAWHDKVVIDTFVTGEGAGADGRGFDTVLESSEYDIVHYAGHARFDHRRPDQSALILDGPEECSAQKIHRLLSGSPLVFLNACETARLSEPGGPAPGDGSYEGDPKEGLASAFLYRGAVGCIGNVWLVPDRVAAHFAIVFYNGVLNGEPLGAAMLSARRSTAHRFKDLSWASFVFYGDPGLSIGPVQSPKTGA